MSGGQNRRFPRTASAIPEARPTIEREKIRHRRPNDLLFDSPEPPVTRRSLLTDDDVGETDAVDHDVYDQDTGDDWTVPREEASEAVVWGDEPEDDWVLAGDDDRGAEIYDEDGYVDDDDESGVVWEDDAFVEPDPAEEPDELSFGRQEATFGFAPEVELAGRRDVRPKPPRAAAQPRAGAPRPQPRREPSPGQHRSRPHRAGHRPVETEPDLEGPSFREVPPPGPRGGWRPQDGPSAESGRFSRTRATMGVAEEDAGEEVLQRPRQGPSQRRRLAQAAPSSPNRASALPNLPKRDRYGAIRSGRGRRKGLIAAVVLMLLAAGGWYAYRTIGPDGIGPMIERLTAIVPLPGATRTAADTSFGDPETEAAVTSEQALADLERRIQQQEGGDLPSDAAASGTDAPPIPKLKPLAGATRSLSSEVPAAAAGDQPQLAANEEEGGDGEAGALSIFQQLWRYLNPG